MNNMINNVDIIIVDGGIGFDVVMDGCVYFYDIIPLGPAVVMT